MKNNKRQALVEQVANAMCANENRISTKRLKIEMRNQYPSQTWNKYNDGKNSGVSEYFHQLVREGKFVSIADNGTYQTYACTALPIVSKKGDSYIHDMEEAPKGTINTMAKLVRAIKSSIRTNMTAAKSAPVSTPAPVTKRGSKTGVKRGTYNTKAKKAAVATAMGIPSVIASVLTAHHAATVATGKKRGPYNTKAKIAAAVKAVYATPPMSAGIAPLINGLKKAGITPSKTPGKVLGGVNAPRPKVTHNVRTISKTEALKKIQAYKGKLKFATFIKQDGTTRTMRFELIDPIPTVLGYLRVTDLHIAAKKDVKDDGMRNINMQTLKNIKLGRYTCNVK